MLVFLFRPADDTLSLYGDAGTMHSGFRTVLRTPVQGNAQISSTLREAGPPAQNRHSGTSCPGNSTGKFEDLSKVLRNACTSGMNLWAATCVVAACGAPGRTLRMLSACYLHGTIFCQSDRNLASSGGSWPCVIPRRGPGFQGRHQASSHSHRRFEGTSHGKGSEGRRLS